MRFLYFFSLLFACTGENVIDKQENIAPTILIASHGDSTEIQEGYLEQFRATVSDDDNTFNELQVAWYVGEDIVCDWTEASPAGESFCDIVFVPEDNNVIAEVRDSVGAGARAEISISIIPTEAPVVEILSPESGAAYYSDQLIEFSALVSDLEDNPLDLMVVWTSNIDGELSLGAEVDTSGEISDYGYLSEGQHALELRVEDTTGKVTTESVVIEVGGNNNEPSCGITSPQTGLGYVVGQNITFSGAATDDDINNSLLNITWESNQDGIFDSTAASTTGELSVVYNGLSIGNHIITLRVEDEVAGLCTDTVNVAIGTPPALSVTSPTNGDIISLGEQVLFAAVVNDNEDIASDVNVSWISDIDGEFSTTGANSNGNISFNYSNFTAGTHGITVTATDSSGLTDTTSVSLHINTPPPAPTVVLNPDPVTASNTLSALVTNSSDADGDNITYSYEWYENAILTANVGSAISASDLSVGEIWTVRVTPNDGYIDGNFTESSITVSNSIPVISSLSISPTSNVSTNSVLTCTVSASDADGGMLSFSFTFTNQTTNTVYSTTTGTSIQETLDLSSTSVASGDVIECSVTATDTDGGSVTNSTSVVVVNDIPTFSSAASISPNTGVYTGTTLLCSASATDTEDGLITPSYQWTVGTNILGSGSTYVVDASTTNVADVVTCTATATDSDSQTATSTANITIENTLPTLSSVSISPNSGVYNDSILTCTATATDPDEILSPTIQWTVDSNIVGQSSVLDLATVAAIPQDDVICTASVVDSSGGSDSDSATLTIINRAPTAPTITVSPTSPVPGQDDIVCNIYNPSTDLDGQTVNYTYGWSTNGSPTSYTSDVIPASDIGGGEVWECTVTPDDGIDNGLAASASVTVFSSWSGARTFTTCGQTGQTGPDQQICDSEYAGTTLDGEVTLSGGIQQWTVPASGTYIIESVGAASGIDSSSSVSGQGASIQGEVYLTQGEVLYIMVGQKGSNNSGYSAAIGGGGGTFVVRAPYTSLTDAIMVAGGGGGCESCGSNNRAEFHGQIGQDGEDGWSSCNQIGTGGTNGMGGSCITGNSGGGGGGFLGNGVNGCPGGDGGLSFVNGGFGGTSLYHDAHGGFGGGGGAYGYAGGSGGGGGYSGGAGGDNCSSAYAGGGGSYNSGQNQVNSSGVNPDHGYVIIEQ
jgi:hypothetical protein